MNLILSFADAFPGFALSVALRACALALVCVLALWLLRGLDSTVRYLAWRLVLFGMLLLPVTLPLPAIVHLPRVPPIRSEARGRSISISPSPAPPNSQQTETVQLHQAPEPSPASRIPLPWSFLALAAYLSVSGILFFRIVLGRKLMNRAVRRMERVDDSGVLERANRQCEALGLLTFPEFRVGESTAVPVTFGWRNPVIVLPADWRDWPADKLDLVLAHELSHIQRGDYLIRLASALNKSLYWFHPLVWWLDRRLMELGEHLSDDAALAAVSVDRQRYANILGDFAGQLGPSSGRFELGIAMSAPASGSRRIKRILDRQRALCTRVNWPQKLAVFGFGVPTLVLVAGAQVADRPQTSVSAQVQPPEPQIQTSASPRRVQPPMFSRMYTDALKDILDLEPADVADLERQLEENPADFAARLKLIAYFMRADQIALPENRTKRVNLILWLVEHQPDSETLGSQYAILSPADITADQLTEAKRWWQTATAPGQADARVFWNAANFYQQLDRRSYVVFLESTAALAPDNERYAFPLGLLYGEAILTVNPQSMYRDPSGADPEFARHAIDVLDTTRNPYILEPAAKLLQDEYNKSLTMGKQNTSVGAMAQRYFDRAKALDPGLDEAWIHPPIDPKMIGMLAPGAKPPDAEQLDFDSAAKRIRRLSPDAFPALPPEIRTELRNRGCLVPEQTAIHDEAFAKTKNVIEGEFFEKGKTSWAVLCSVNESSSILVFRDALDRHPDELAKSEDKSQLQGIGNGEIAYSRLIQPADSKFILKHYRAYGGPEPPPLDHQGIDDAFLEKASVTYYWYRGEWLKFTGSD